MTTLYKVVRFDNSDGNFTGNPKQVGDLMTRDEAKDTLVTVRHIAHQFINMAGYRYIMVRAKVSR